MPTTPDPLLDAETETALARRLFNGTWALLEKPDRTPADDDLVVNSAHASLLHWTNVGGPKELVIGHWMVARVYSELRRAEPAVHHARRAQAIAASAQVEPWVTASVLEGLARAYAVSGDRAAASEWRVKAVTALGGIDDPDDREIVERDIESLPL